MEKKSWVSFLLILTCCLSLWGCKTPIAPKEPMIDAYEPPRPPSPPVYDGYYLGHAKFEPLFQFHIEAAEESYTDARKNASVPQPNFFIPSDEDFLERRYTENGARKADEDLIEVNDTEPFAQVEKPKRQQRLAVLDLKSDVQTAGAPGRLASDMAYQSLYLQQKGRIYLLDRNEAYEALKQQAATTEKDLETLSPEEQIKFLSNTTGGFADFFIHGAVTQYSLENMNASMPYLLKEEEVVVFATRIQPFRDLRMEYDQEYKKYEQQWKAYEAQFPKSWAEYEARYTQYGEDYYRYVPQWRAYQEELGTMGRSTPAKQPKSAQPALSPFLPEKEIKLPNTDRQTVEKQFRPNPPFQSRTLTVANVGITLRLVDPKGKILWIGNAAARSTNQQRAMKLLCEALIRRMAHKCQAFLIVPQK